MRRAPGIDASDVLLSVTTFSFDIFGLEIWLPLTSGAKAVIAPREIAMDGRRLAALMARCGATMMQATPSTWRLLVDSGWAGSPCLKILCGGEAWSQDLAAQLLPKCTSLWNMYGPTETTIWSAVCRVQDEKGVLIGRPIANTQFYVVDSYLQPVPLGVTGELLIGGDGLAAGYLNRPDLTAEKFIPNPFSTKADSRLYRTGDLVRYLPDGNIEFLGRSDHQVKIRGFRIELGEIENALRACRGIAQAVVTVRVDEGDKSLAAYVVPSGESTWTDVELRSHLRQSLPDYMTPSVFVFLSKLPLSPNGKVDIRSLPAPGAVDSQVTLKAAAPRDIIEQQLTRIWEKVLRVAPIGVTDDFFDLGGHSFAALRLMSELQKVTGRNLPLATLFQAPTVERLAGLLRRDGWSPSWSSLVPIQPGGSRPPVFLAHGAEGNVLLYRQLARHLGANQPVYGLQSQGLSADARIHGSIEEMAAHYVREVRTLQPGGPYYVGGYCLGGIIALEMAQQLSEHGDTVAAVIMIDSYNPTLVPTARLNQLKPIHLLQNLWFHGANLLAAQNIERWKFLKDKLAVLSDRIRVRVVALWSAVQNYHGGAGANKYPHLRIKEANDAAAMPYVPRPYHGCVHVVRPKGYFRGLDEPDLGWGKLIQRGLNVHPLPVYRKGILVEPFVRMLAECMNQCLERSGQPAGLHGDHWRAGARSNP